MFSIRFNQYLKERKCSAKIISSLTNISEATVSRYKRGKTVPSIESGNIESIAKALASLPGGNADREQIFEDLLVAAYEDLELVDYAVFSSKLSLLLNKLEISKKKLADSIHISSSYLFKICSGQSKPRNPVYLAETISRYIMFHYAEEEQCRLVQSLIFGSSIETNAFSSNEEYFRYLKRWLLTGESAKSVLVDNLLHRYGEYDIATYLPGPSRTQSTALVNNKSFKTYTGQNAAENAFFSWVESACSSNVNDEIFLYDELFFTLAMQNPKGTHKYYEAIEKLIKSGKKLVFVNNLQNDIYATAEKMVVWLPITMSGRILNYYVSEPTTQLYKNALLVSSDAALIGSMIGNDYEHGYYALVKSPNEILIARHQAKNILIRANSVNRLYSNRKELIADLSQVLSSLQKDDPIFLYLPVPPLSTMDENLLHKILQRNNISPVHTEQILKHYRKEREINEKILKDHFLNICIDYYDEERWSKEPLHLALDDREINLLLTYEYDEYQQHIETTKALAEQHKSAHLTVERMNFYKNMNIIYIPDKYAAAVSLRGSSVDVGSTKKLIVNAFAELLYSITPRNEPEVLKNEKQLKILTYYKQITTE